MGFNQYHSEFSVTLEVMKGCAIVVVAFGPSGAMKRNEGSNVVQPLLY